MDDHTPDTVGVDISKAHLDAHRRSTGESARFANEAAGFEELAAWIGDPAALLVYEATGHWHRGLEEHLADRQPLARVNPLRARRFAQAMGEEAKTDAADARTLAAMGASVEVRLVEPRSAARGADVDPRHRPGGRARPRRMLYMAAVSASRCNPDMARTYAELRERGKPPKVALTAIMRKLVVLANALLKQDRTWTPEPVRG